MYRFKLAKILKVLLVTGLIILCVLALWALVLYVLGLDLQWWVKVMILSCLAVTLFFAVLVRKLILKRREMKFVDGIIGPDELPGSVSQLSEASRELRGRFKQAVSTLKKSHLKHQGNPLYVLPWYLVVGRSGAGKSTAVKSARLSSPFGDFNRVAGIEGTRNCDWWFFDESVVIDIAGRYSVHRNEELDKKEWRTFLEHLVRYRKKEPINGVIVTAEANRLMESSVEKNEEEGQILRKRIDEITSIMGAKFPVYLLVTKTDLIYGVERYFRLLSESSVSQAMGLMNHDGEKDVAAFVNKTIDTITEKLKDFRLIMANDKQVVGRYSIEPEVLLFPNEFERLRTGMIAFSKGAFKENPFQEQPFLRGIYFSSGCQEGEPLACLANSMGKLSKSLSKMNVANQGNSKNGYFLFDFFAKILPTDRSLYSLTHRAKEWHRLTHNLWLAGFVAIVMIFCILVTYSWNENRAILNSVSPKFRKTLIFSDDPIANIGLMADFSQQINDIEARNDKWKIPRMGLKASIELEDILKKKYCRRFKAHFDESIHNSIKSKVADGGWIQNEYAAAIQFIPFVVRRINMINGKFSGADFDALSKLPAPNFALMIHGDKAPTLDQEIANRYKHAYVNYLIWQNDVEALNNTLVGLQGLLKNYFHENNGDFRWLEYWANQNRPDKAIRMNDFWRTDASDADLPSIGPVYTAEGRKLISDFVLNELEKAVEESSWIIKPKEKFLAQYKKNFYGSWRNFALDFGKGKALFKDEEQWASAIERFYTLDSPYLELLKTMSKQLLAEKDDKWPSLKTDEKKDKDINQWLAQIKDYKLIKEAVGAEALSGNQDIKNEASMRLSYRTKLLARLAKAGMSEGRLSRGKNAFKLYLEALQGFEGLTDSRSSAYAVARAGFDDEPGESKSAIFKADRAVDKLKVAMKPKNGRKSSGKNDPFWCLFTDPIDELWRYSVRQAGDHLQQVWDREVIVAIQDINDKHKLGAMLFGDGGLVDKYAEKHSGAFLQRSSRRGYHSKKIRGCSIPFKQNYFAFMRSGRRWLSQAASRSGQNSGPAQHAVDVEAYPTDVNIEARVKPHMTRLTIDGVEGSPVLENRHYPNAKKFVWSSEKNGDVTVQIMIGDITLTRRYSGRCSFCNFIRDFQNGTRTFTVSDFPGYRHEFKRMGVTRIEVAYRFKRGQISPILNHATRIDITPGRPPADIVTVKKAG